METETGRRNGFFDFSYVSAMSALLSGYFLSRYRCCPIERTKDVKRKGIFLYTYTIPKHVFISISLWTGTKQGLCQGKRPIQHLYGPVQTAKNPAGLRHHHLRQMTGISRKSPIMIQNINCTSTRQQSELSGF